MHANITSGQDFTMRIIGRGNTGSESYYSLPGYGSLTINDLALLANNQASRILFLVHDAKPTEEALQDSLQLVLMDVNGLILTQAGATIASSTPPRQSLTQAYNIMNLIGSVVGQVVIIVALIRRCLCPVKDAEIDETESGMIKALQDEKQNDKNTPAQPDDHISDAEVNQSRANLLGPAESNNDSQFL